jgi:pimeloyl-ACP methyl ester carboxylesterase
MASESSFTGFNILHKTVEINGLDIFYREAGPKDAFSILLLHGFPTSSHMFRNLIPALSDKYHLVAPDYPGFGNSSMPKVDEFDYTFDNIAEIMDAFIQKIGLATKKSSCSYSMIMARIHRFTLIGKPISGSINHPP